MAVIVVIVIMVVVTLIVAYFMANSPGETVFFARMHLTGCRRNTFALVHFVAKLRSSRNEGAIVGCF